VIVANQDRLFAIGAKRSRGRCRRTYDETLAALRATGRVEKVDSAVIGLCRVLADELDDACRDTDESRYTRGTLAARYQSALTFLLARPDTANDVDDLASLLAAVRHDTAGG
jgi:hypothetical protein